MDIKDFRELLEKCNDKFSIFADLETLRKYNFNVIELVQSINDFLSDEEKAKLFELEHFKKLSPNINYRILKTIADNKIKLEILQTSSIIDGFKDYEIMDIIKYLDSSSKIQILHNSAFLKKHNITEYEIDSIIEGLDSKCKQQLLEDKEFVQDDLHLKNYKIGKIIAGIENEETKIKFVEKYNLETYIALDVIKTFSNGSKIDILLKKQFGNNYTLDKNNIEQIAATLEISTLCTFFKEHKDFLQENDIKPYRIVEHLNKDQQLEFLTKFENMGLTLTEKRQILVTLDQETKKEVDRSKFPQEYITAIEIQVENDFGNLMTFGKIIPDFNKDLKIYQGLDELIYLNPINMTEEQRKKHMSYVKCALK